MSTIECSCRLWPMPGMYVVTSMPFVRRTRATFRRAEFGFFGVCVYTRVQTPRFCGHDWRAGLLVLAVIFLRPLRTSWLSVGTSSTLLAKLRDKRAKGPSTSLGGPSTLVTIDLIETRYR